MVKVTHQGQGRIKAKVKNVHPSDFMYPIVLRKRVVCIRLKCILVLNMMRNVFIYPESHSTNTFIGEQ